MNRSHAVPPDPGLPGLSELVPARGAPAAVSAFAATLGSDVDPEASRLVYVRYRPTRSCVALWSFARGTRPALWVWAKQVHGAARLHRAHESIRELAARIEAATGTVAWRILPERGLLLHALGLDARLPSLLQAGDPEWARERLAPGLGLRAGVALESAHGLSYKPERRCVYHYRWDPASGGGSHYAKLFRDERGERLLAWQRALATGLRAQDGAWLTVAPAAYLPAERMLVFPALAGEKATRLIEAVVDGRAPLAAITAHVTRAARGLAALQRIRIDGLAEGQPEALLARFASDANEVARVEPALADAVRIRLDRLDAARDRLSPEPLVPSHGAFRHGQLLLRDRSTVVLDFDTLARSGASADAGNFLAYLELTAQRRPRLRGVLEACRDSFRAALPEPLSPWLAWYEALSLLKVTLRSFLSLDPAWPRLAPALLRVADEALAKLPAGARRAAAC